MVYILLAEGFEEVEALAPADLLRRAGVETALVSLKGEWVTGGHGITVKADMELEQVKPEEGDMVMLPGGALGVANLDADPRVEALVRTAVEKGLWLSAICAAPSLPAKWGLLEGKRAVCYPSWSDKLTGAEFCPGEKLAQDGTIITGQAAGAAVDFGLKLIEVLCGADKAREVAHGICY